MPRSKFDVQARTLHGDVPVQIMGIINVTPDSFSDGGKFTSEQAIVDQADAMIAHGADILDIGGESTRPFAEPVSIEGELNRVIPAILSIRKHHTIPISIDTTKAEVARKAIEAGANIVNDISGLRFDPLMADVVRDHQIPVIIMHMLGTPADMQIKPVYNDVIVDIMEFFRERLDWMDSQGIDHNQIILDPGIGFGKTTSHNLSILKRLAEFQSLGCPVLVGHSRKSFIGKILDLEVDERDIGTAALSAVCVMSGVSILRVHDVAKTAQAVRLAEAVLSAP